MTEQTATEQAAAQAIPGRRLAVHSRVIKKDGPQLFDSVILIQPSGNVRIAG